MMYRIRNLLSRILTFPFLLLIRGYQKFISPLTGAHCRFRPTCSEYAIEALRTHGLFKGLVLSIWRILRCNPFGKPGYDPVPPKGKWHNETRDKPS